MSRGTRGPNLDWRDGCGKGRGFLERLFQQVVGLVHSCDFAEAGKRQGTIHVPSLACCAVLSTVAARPNVTT